VPPPDAATTHYLGQQAIAQSAVASTRALWAQLDPTALTESWTDDVIGSQILARVSTGQFLAASRADAYLDAVTLELSIDAPASAAVGPRAFAGVASDGRNLSSLIYEPVITSKVAMANGATITDAMQAGQDALTRIVGTQVQDAGRTAVGTGIAARPAITTWVRMLNPPSCSRCVVLAGKRFRWNQGFARHPLCDCRHIPSTENVAGDLTTNPRTYFDSLSTTDQDKYFTAAGAEAIRNGADISQVVNARRSGLYMANGQLATLEGTTRRGIAGSRLQAAGSTTKSTGGRYTRVTEPRLMPETIMANAADRDEAIAQLRRYAYLV
jgi:hypothetical protein